MEMIDLCGKCSLTLPTLDMELLFAQKMEKNLNMNHYNKLEEHLKFFADSQFI